MSPSTSSNNYGFGDLRIEVEQIDVTSNWPDTFGPWEGGYTDSQGQLWIHMPWVGWQKADRRGPFVFVGARKSHRPWWHFWRR